MKRAPVPALALDRDRPAVGLGHSGDDRQAEADQAPRSPEPRGEALEQMVADRRVDAGALVGDDSSARAVPRRARARVCRPRRRVADRVLTR